VATTTQLEPGTTGGTASHPTSATMADEGKFREAMILKLFKAPYIFLQMEFLDINKTKDLSLLLHAIHGPFCWRILKKTILFAGFKILKKKPRNNKTRVYS
jgi:hypothetical protein